MTRPGSQLVRPDTEEAPLSGMWVIISIFGLRRIITDISMIATLMSNNTPRTAATAALILSVA